MNPYRLLWTTALGSLLIAGCSSSDKPVTQVSRDSLVPVVGTNELPAGKWANPLKARQKSGTLVAPGGKLDAYTQATTGGTAAAPSRPARGGKPVERNNSGDYNLNFVDVEVGEMARAVLRDVLQVAYLIDERVQGRVSIETPRPVQRDALITILEASLRSIGAGLVVNDDLYQIVPLEVAANQLGPLDQGSVGVVPVRLRFVDAEMLIGALAPFAQDLVGMSADPQRNMLILSGDRTQLGNLLGLIDSLDSNVLAETSFALTPLQMAEAPAVARELEAIFVNSGGIRFLPIDRQNAVLAIARNPEVLATSQAWIKRLDRRGGSNDQGIYVYQVESGDTAELAATVSSLFGLGQPSGDLGDFADEGSGIAPSLTPAAIGASAASLGDNGDDQPDFAGAADPLDLNPFAGGPSPLSGSGSGSGNKSIKMVPHPATNTIVVMSTEQQWNRIETTLRRLDQIPLQVMIDATVVEVTLNDDLRYGVQVALEAGNSLFSLTDSINLSAVGGNIPIPSGFAFALEAGNVKLLLDALSEITDIKVLTSPRLMVTSSKSARLVVGDQVPVPVQSATPIDSNNGFLVNTVEFRDTGVILDVTPRVSPSGLINLDINQEVSDVVPTNSSNIDAPTISQRQVASSVAVQSGDTVILGGLTAETDVYATSRIPILGALPVLGPLFGSTVSTQSRTELLVMIKPKIIRNADDARAVATELRQRLNRLAVPDQPFAPAPPPPSRTPPARTSSAKPSVKTTGL